MSAGMFAIYVVALVEAIALSICIGVIYHLVRR